MKFVFIYFAALFLPGYLIHVAWYTRPPDYLTAFSLSLSFLALGLFALINVQAHSTHLVWSLPSLLLTIVVAGLLVNRRKIVNIRQWLRFSPHKVHAVAACVLILIIGFHLYFTGIYLEVPADVWRHLGYSQDARRWLQIGSVMQYPSLWYSIPAGLQVASDVEPSQFVQAYGALSTLVYCGGLYAFAFAITLRFTANRHRAAIIGLLAVALSAFSVGVDTFSYVRYYVFAPTFQNILVYFCSLLILIRVFESGRVTVADFSLLCTFSLTMFVVHKQELSFLYVNAIALSIVVILSSRRAANAWLGAKFTFRDGAATISVPWFSVAVVVLSLLFFVYSRYSFAPQSDLHPWVVPLSSIFPFGEHIYIADPYSRVYSSITIWGIAIYLLFVIHFRVFEHQLYLLSGMLIPLITVFNPLFVDLFFRHNEAAPIYRYMYIVPLGLVGSILIVRYIDILLHGPLLHRFAAFSGACLLVLLLFPNQIPLLHNSNSRLYTLTAIPDGNDYRRWADLLNFLERNEQHLVLSDAVTGYMIRGMTPHIMPGYKFHFPYARLGSLTETYQRYTGAVLVINRRDGDPSINGKLTGHWPENVLSLSQNYPEPLLSMIEEKTDVFRLIWQHDDIGVFKIVDPNDTTGN